MTAVTTQLAPADALRLDPSTAQFAVAVENVTAPPPDPPAAAKPRSVPTDPDLTVFDTTNGTWAAPANVNTFATEVAAA